MAIKLQIRRGTASQWTSADPALLAGEIGYETDTGNVKIGTGVAWTALPYLSSSVPALSSAQTTLDHADYRRAGRFTISASVTTAIPSAWVTGSDAPGVLVVTVSGSNVVQTLISTKTQKAFQRAYDGSTWTTWVADTLYADSVGTTEIANNAVTTAKIINDAVTFAKMQNSAAAGLSVVGRSTNSAGDFGEITAANDAEVLRRSGSSIVFATVATNSIANGAVTSAKLANGAVTGAQLGTQVVQKNNVFTANGTWVAPATTAGVVITVIGGGGGGGASNNPSQAGGTGGNGGRIVAYLSVTPGASYAVTVGTGGAGSNATVAGTTGGTSTFLGVTATGGDGGPLTSNSGLPGTGADGAGSNGTQPSGVTLHSSWTPGQRILHWSLPVTRTSGTTTAVAFNVNGSFPAGSGGLGETNQAANNSRGGVGGLVEVTWFEFA